mgnify:CR=1 FL=1
MYTNAVDAIQSIPFLGGKIKQMRFVVSKENSATIVEAEFDENKIVVKVDTQERGTERILENIMELFGLKESPDLFWTSGPNHCFCWITDLAKKDEIIAKMKKEMTVIKFIWQK